MCYPLLIIFPTLFAFGAFCLDGQDNSAGERWSTAERGHPGGGQDRSPVPSQPRRAPPWVFIHRIISAGLVFLRKVSLIPARGSHATAGIPGRPSSRPCTDLLLKSRRLQRCLCCLMRGTMQEGGPASLRNGCLNSSCAVALCEGSRTSIESKKPRRTEETCNIALALGMDKDTRLQPTLGLRTLLFLGRQGTH